MREYRRPRRWATVTGVVAVLLTLGFAAAAVLSVPVSGQSMEPTLASGNRILVRPAGDTDVPRFAIVVGRFAATGPIVLKRVIGLPGDRLSIEKYGDRPGVVRVQPGGAGAWYQVDNPAWAARWRPVAGNCCGPDGRATPRPEVVTVPDGMLFVLGDNIGASEDSRARGWLPGQLVAGRAAARLLPPGRPATLSREVTLRPIG